MKSPLNEIPVYVEVAQGVSRQVEWGGMLVGVVTIKQELDAAPLFTGLKDDRCQLPHWGYIIDGRLRCKFATHEEVYDAGEVFHIPPGHTPIYEKGLVFVEFSPCEEARKQSETVNRNIEAMLK